MTDQIDSQVIIQVKSQAATAFFLLSCQLLIFLFCAKNSEIEQNSNIAVFF